MTTGRVKATIYALRLPDQIRNVLIKNALRHGRGTVTILVSGTSVLIQHESCGLHDAKAATIFDRPADHQAGHRRSLALVRQLADADGGRLELTAQHPATFTLSLLAVRR